MKKVVFVLLLSFMAVYAKAQEIIQLSDLAGKWKLTKIEEVQIREDVEVDNKQYALSDYSGAVSFDGFECFSDGNVSYAVLEGEPENIGSIQLNERNNSVFFHDKKGGSSPYDFRWQVKPTSFSIDKVIKRNQQAKEKTVARFFYEKQ